MRFINVLLTYLLTYTPNPATVILPAMLSRELPPLVSHFLAIAAGYMHVHRSDRQTRASILII